MGILQSLEGSFLRPTAALSRSKDHKHQRRQLEALTKDNFPEYTSILEQVSLFYFAKQTKTTTKNVVWPDPAAQASFSCCSAWSGLMNEPSMDAPISYPLSSISLQGSLPGSQQLPLQLCAPHRELHLYFLLLECSPRPTDWKD